MQEQLKKLLVSYEDEDKIIELLNKILANNQKNDLLFILKSYIKHPKIRNYIKLNLDNLLKTSNNCQLVILLLLEQFLDLSIEQKKIIELSKKLKVTLYEEDYLGLESIIIYDCLKEFFDLVDRYTSLSKDNNIQYIDCGRSSYVYRIGDYTLKTGYKRDTPYFNDRFYRFVKRFERIVLEKDGIPNFFLEVQPYFTNVGCGVYNHMVEELLEDCYNHGYELLDCHNHDCLLLDDYSKADINQKVSDSFIKRPVILVDVDAIKKI